MKLSKHIKHLSKSVVKHIRHLELRNEALRGHIDMLNEQIETSTPQEMFSFFEAKEFLFTHYGSKIFKMILEIMEDPRNGYGGVTSHEFYYNCTPSDLLECFQPLVDVDPRCAKFFEDLERIVDSEPDSYYKAIKNELTDLLQEELL